MRASIKLVALVIVIAGCRNAPKDANDSEARNLWASVGQSDEWYYNGPMPALEGAEIFASQTAHTLRITGLVPENFKGALPAYANAEVIDGRTRVNVVYPIATGASTVPLAKDYTNVSLVPRVTKSHGNDYGGFPYIEFDHGRNFAFHGPITTSWETDYQWELIRGKVSGGCNRMQGEHVLELAQMLGGDMRNSSIGKPEIPLKIVVHILHAADRIGAEHSKKFVGKVVDVNYDPDKSFVRPSEHPELSKNVQMFPTWNAMKNPDFILQRCRDEKGDRKVNATTRCVSKAPAATESEVPKSATQTICAKKNINVFNAAGTVIGTAKPGEPVESVEEAKNNRVRLYFFNEPAGFGFVQTTLDGEATVCKKK